MRTLNIIKQRNTSIVYKIINNTEGNVQINISVVDSVYNTLIEDAQIEVTGDITTTTTSGILIDTTLVPGEYTITIDYPETDEYKTSQTTIDFTVEIDKDKVIEDLNNTINNLTEEIEELKAPKQTTLTFDPVTDARYNANVTITGTLVNDESVGLFNQIVTLTIGEREVNVTTIGGIFQYTTVFKTMDEQTVIARYAGSDKYNASEDSITFTIAKQDVIVTVESITDAVYGDNVTITGKFTTAEGKAISNSNVRIFVNDKKYYARTDSTGAYTLSAKVTQVGENTVRVGYGGNDKYNEYETSITFNADKQDVIVTVDSISEAKVGDNVTITGKFTDANGKAITNSNVRIFVNGKKYYARTDSTGTYTISVAVTAVGINNVSVGYGGSDKYNAYESNTTFNAISNDVIVTYEPISDVTLGENVSITGTFTDINGKAITNSNVKIIINGKKYYARTDNTGKYTLSVETTVEGVNNVTIGYGGSAKYNAYETSTTFTVLKA